MAILYMYVDHSIPICWSYYTYMLTIVCMYVDQHVCMLTIVYLYVDHSMVWVSCATARTPVNFFVHIIQTFHLFLLEGKLRSGIHVCLLCMLVKLTGKQSPLSHS